MAKVKKVRITIHLDQAVLSYVRSLAQESGSPYQTFLNKLLRETVGKKLDEGKRHDRIKKELERLKKKVAA